MNSRVSASQFTSVRSIFSVRQGMTAKTLSMSACVLGFVMVLVSVEMMSEERNGPKNIFKTFLLSRPFERQTLILSHWQGQRGGSWRVKTSRESSPKGDHFPEFCGF